MTGVEPVAERRDPQALLDAALGQARALLDERDALRSAASAVVTAYEEAGEALLGDDPGPALNRLEQSIERLDAALGPKP